MLFTKNIKKIYLIGIKGTGMSSLAVMLKNLGYKVTGSDTKEKFFTESQLKKNKIKYFEKFSFLNIRKSNPDLIITSTAYDDKNQEILQSKKSDKKIITYPEAIGYLSKDLKSVAICGSHGKTTTTAMLGKIMGDLAITLVGSIAETSKNKSPNFFIFEADEYQDKFRHYFPKNLILTNIDYDHPDFFKTESQYVKTFKKFINKVLDKNGFIIYNHDDSFSKNLFKKQAKNTLNFGLSDGAQYQVKNINDGLNEFEIFKSKKKIIGLELNVYGKHNILNSAAAVLMALHLGIKKETIQKKLLKFKGAKRRMEVIPSKKYLIIDDYGHHPTEISATLSAIRNKYKNKNIVTIFHPHTFTRTKALFKDFGKSFKDSDLTIVIDIYPSARETLSINSGQEAGGVHSKDLVKEIIKNKSRAIYQSTIPDAAKYIKKNVKNGSVILTIGAGDVWKLCNLIK